MKVSSEMSGEYRDCERAWKKIHQFKKEQGAIEGWALERIVSPAGSSNDYNYVTRKRFKDVNQLAAYQDNPYMPENWKSLLTEKEIELVNRTNKIRTWVKSEVWSTEERILSEDVDDSQIVVVNHFSIPANKMRSDHMKMERDLWMPVHKKRIKDGSMMGWLLLQRELPIGTDHGASVATVDVYKDMAQFWQPFDEDEFLEVHPGKSMDEIWKETLAAGTRSSAEIRRAIDSTE